MKKKLLTGLATGLLVFGIVGMANANLINVAPLGSSIQSSDAFSGAGEAFKAIDGDTNAKWNYSNYSLSSITHTNKELNAWWQVDLDKTYDIEKLVIWNRANEPNNGNIEARLSPFTVSIFDTTQSTVNAVWSTYFTDIGLTFSFDFKNAFKGDRVKIQLGGTNYLHLAEVEVFTEGAGAPVPEPATMLLLGTGLVGLASSRVKRRKKA